MTPQVYAGIGSRKTPESVLEKMYYRAQDHALSGSILRSGGATGADHAFYKGAGHGAGRFEIFLPWKGFNGFISQELRGGGFVTHEIDPKAFEIASEIHPAWARLSEGAKKLHARNIHQILGRDLKSPVDFVLCWTEGGKVIGGTATAINLAKKLNIPVTNFGV